MLAIDWHGDRHRPAVLDAATAPAARQSLEETANRQKLRPAPASEVPTPGKVLSEATTLAGSTTLTFLVTKELHTPTARYRYKPSC